jgi:hypothetical protein
MATFRMDLQQNYNFDLSSFKSFEESIQRLPSQLSNPTKKAITFLQKYLSGQKSLKGKNFSIPRKDFFTSDQFIDTFTNELSLLKVLEAPETYAILKQQQTKESKSGITLFLDAVFRKEGGESWRTNIFQKNLLGDGTLCKYVQPVTPADINIDTDYTIRANITPGWGSYVNGLDPARGPLVRQNNPGGNQLFNYNFTPGVLGGLGFNIQGTCYLCGTRIGNRVAGQFDVANCEHIMPILSALQASDFFLSKNEVTPRLAAIKAAIIAGGVGPTPADLDYIDKLLKISPEFAWSHRCCNMLKSDVDFLYLDTNNGQYSPHLINIEIYLNWLFDRNNAELYDCSIILQQLTATYPNLVAAKNSVRASIMLRVNQLCLRLNASIPPLNNYRKELLKVYGIFLLLQHLKVSTIDNIVGRVKFGGFTGVVKKPIEKDLKSREAKRRELERKSNKEKLVSKILMDYQSSSDEKWQFYSSFAQLSVEITDPIKKICTDFVDVIPDEIESDDNTTDDLIRAKSNELAGQAPTTLRTLPDQSQWVESIFYDYMKLRYSHRKLTEYGTKLPEIFSSLSPDTFCLFWNDIPIQYRKSFFDLLIAAVIAPVIRREDVDTKSQAYDIIFNIIMLCYNYNTEYQTYLSRLVQGSPIVMSAFAKISSNEATILFIWNIIPHFLQRKIFQFTIINRAEWSKISGITIEAFITGIQTLVNNEIIESCAQIDGLTQDFTTLQKQIVEEVNLFKGSVPNPNVSLQEYYSTEYTLNSIFAHAMTAASQQEQREPEPPQPPDGILVSANGGKLIRKRKTTRRNVVVIKRKKHNKSRKHKTRKHKTRKHKTRKHKRL